MRVESGWSGERPGGNGTWRKLLVELDTSDFLRLVAEGKFEDLHIEGETPTLDLAKVVDGDGKPVTTAKAYALLQSYADRLLTFQMYRDKLITRETFERRLEELS